ncbi:MAG: hypothetical protein IJA54_03615 [Tyzzerella sp.]|nr:hypothetical protein [Tyzzerella sp.]
MVKKRKFTKVAFVLSICLLLLWGLLGTGTSIAWFMDETPELVNSFEFADFDLEVYYKVTNAEGDEEWVLVDEKTKVFDEEALYEPGYTQVVYLKIVNKGDVEFDYQLSVNMNDFVPGVNEAGQLIYLPNYLKFGALIEKDEQSLTREVARAIAIEDLDNGSAPSKEMLPLNTYSSSIGQLEAEAGEDSVDYAALILYMPEKVGNEANYRGDDIPRVDLGITVLASQRGTLD